jgi:hypothetical protein
MWCAKVDETAFVVPSNRQDDTFFVESRSARIGFEEEGFHVAHLSPRSHQHDFQYSRTSRVADSKISHRLSPFGFIFMLAIGLTAAHGNRVGIHSERDDGWVSNER